MKGHSVLRSLVVAGSVIAALGGVLAVPGGVGPAPAWAQGKEPVKVGVVLPMTSVLAPYGKPVLEAIQMAVEDANKKGGVNGRQIELVVEDAANSNTVAINAFNKVLLSKPVAVMGPGIGTQILALLPLINKEKLVTIAAPSTRKVTQQGSAYFFRNASHDAIAKESWTRFMVDTLGKKRVGILHVANEWGYSGRDETIKVLESLYKLKPVSIASYQATDKDMTAQLVQMQKDGADVIVSQGHPVDEALIVKQIRQLNMQIPHIGSGSLCWAYTRELVDPKDIAGHYCESTEVPAQIHEKAVVREFADAYKKRLGTYPDAYTTHAYDGAGMLIAVMKAYGTDREQIRKGMRELKYDGIIGPYRSDSEGNLWHGSAIVQFMADGTPKLIKRTTLEPKP